MSFAPGQRWISHADTELGLGVVVGVEERRITLHFPAVEEDRTYASDNAPLSRLRLDHGRNPLEMKVELGEPEAAESERIIRPVRITIPARNLSLQTGESEHVGRLIVVLQSMAENESIFPPQVMELVLRVPADRLSPLTATSATVRPSGISSTRPRSLRASIVKAPARADRTRGGSTKPRSQRVYADSTRRSNRLTLNPTTRSAMTRSSRRRSTSSSKYVV